MIGLALLVSGFITGLLILMICHESAHALMARLFGAKATVHWFLMPRAIIDAPEGLFVSQWLWISRAGYAVSFIIAVLLIEMTIWMPHSLLIVGFTAPFLAGTIITALPETDKKGRHSDGWMSRAFRRVRKTRGNVVIKVNAGRAVYEVGGVEYPLA